MTTRSLTPARSWHAGAVYNGRLYVTGGFGTSYLSEVRYATVNAYGAVDSWNNAFTFGTARREHGSAAYNNYLYVLGGGELAGPRSATFSTLSSKPTASLTTGRPGFLQLY